VDVDARRSHAPPAFDPLSLDAPLLVVAPHPDDESLGCGGLIALWAAAARPLRVLVVTDGAASHPGSSAWPPARLAARRSAEVRDALAALGVAGDAIIQWNLPDGRVPRRGQAGFANLVERGAVLLREARVRTLVVPWRRDPHCDHRAASAVFRSANERLTPTASVLEYPLWVRARKVRGALPRAGEVDEVQIDIRPVLHNKHAAIDAHRSQRGLVVDDVADGFSLEGNLRALCEEPREIYWRARTPIAVPT